jgi:hypothetical protein
MLMAQVQASTADAAVARTQADAALAAQAAHPGVNSERFKPAPPAKFELKNKDLEIRKWLPVIEEHDEGCPPEDYLRLASSHLSGKPRSFYTRASTMLSRLLVLSWLIHVLPLETLCSWAMV